MRNQGFLRGHPESLAGWAKAIKEAEQAEDFPHLIGLLNGAARDIADMLQNVLTRARVKVSREEAIKLRADMVKWKKRAEYFEALFNDEREAAEKAGR